MDLSKITYPQLILTKDPATLLLNILYSERRWWTKNLLFLYS